MGLTGSVAYQILENYAIYFTNASNVAMLTAAVPIITGFTSKVFGRDKSFSGRQIVGCLVAAVGVVITSGVNLRTMEIHPLGDLMVLGAVSSWAVYSIFMDRAMAAGVNPITMVRKSFGWALILVVPVFCAPQLGLPSGFASLGGYTLTCGQECPQPLDRWFKLGNVVRLAFLGLGASAGCFVMWNYACKKLGMVKSTIGLYCCPVVGVVYAICFVGEHVSWGAILGGILILLGVTFSGPVRIRCKKGT